MDEELKEQTEEQPAESTTETQAYDDVEDLSAAFQKLNQIKSEGAKDNLEEPEPEELPDEPAEPAGNVLDESAGDVGRPADNEQEIDWSSRKQQLDDEIKRAAVANTTRKFQEENVKKLKLTDLYVRNERTGDLEFIDPDHPNGKRFTRTEAKAFIRDWNEDIDREMQDFARREYQRISEMYEPRKKLMDFVPTYNKMDELEKTFFDSYVQGYAVKDTKGNVIGYSCDLNKIMNLAKSKADGFKQKYQTKAEPKAPVTRPSTDTKASGASQANDDTEPKNIAEAMKMYNRQKRGNK